MYHSRKQQCFNCEHWKSCPPSTRVYMNYCGTPSATIQERVRHAEMDCRARKKYVLLKLETNLASTLRMQSQVGRVRPRNEPALTMDS